MQIRLKDDRVFSGTARQIVTEMRSVAFGQNDLSLRDYVAFVRSNTERFEGKVLEVSGETDDEIAASLLEALTAADLAEKL